MQIYGIKSKIIRPAKRQNHETKTQDNNQNIRKEGTDLKVIYILELEDMNFKVIKD